MRCGCVTALEVKTRNLLVSPGGGSGASLRRRLANNYDSNELAIIQQPRGISNGCDLSAIPAP